MKLTCSNTAVTSRLRFPALVMMFIVFHALSGWAAKPTSYSVGAASVDITPDYPVRLCGYGVRQNESQGIDQHLFAQALAIGTDKEGPALVLTVDNIIVPAHMRDDLVTRLAKKTRVRNDHLTVCSTHTHCGPMLKNVCTCLYGMDIPADHQAHIDRYTRDLADKLEQVALAALNNRKPATLSCGKTEVGFAWNRRPQGGPVDHELPVLVARDKSGKIVAIWTSYACHCTSIGNEPNHICGDWAGFAREYLERDNPGAVALVSIGCGGDSDPQRRGSIDAAKENGQEICTAIKTLLQQPLQPLSGKLECRARQILLPYDRLFTREEWNERAASPNHWAAYHAKKFLAKLDRGEEIPAALPYLVQTWNFGDQLAMIILAGEPVAEFALLFRKEYDARRVWVIGYANDVPTYVPTRRVWQEGGYEGGAFIYADHPARFCEATEALVVSTVNELMPAAFRAHITAHQHHGTPRNRAGAHGRSHPRLAPGQGDALTRI
jgi:hypothetical protein